MPGRFHGDEGESHCRYVFPGYCAHNGFRGPNSATVQAFFVPVAAPPTFEGPLLEPLASFWAFLPPMGLQVERQRHSEGKRNPLGPFNGSREGSR